MTRSNCPCPPFLSVCKALWGDDVIRLLALTAWRQFWCFSLKQRASRRDVQKRSWCLFSLITLRLCTLPVKKLKKNPWIQGRKKFRNVNLRALKVAGRILQCVCKRCTVISSELECACCKELPFLSKLVEGLLLYTWYFLKLTFQFFISMGNQELWKSMIPRQD